MNLFEQARDAGDMVALAESLTELRQHGRYWEGPCPFCGGTDRFQIKRTDDGDLWICRQCGDGKYQDITAFVARQEGMTMGQAARLLVGEAVIPAGIGTRQARPPAPALQPPDEEWRFHAWQGAMTAAKLLQAGYNYMDSGEDQPHIRAARWLYERGILSPDATRHMLGFQPEQSKRGPVLMPAGITIPHVVYEGDRPVLWGAKVRTRSNKPGNKYRSYKGSAAGALFNSRAAANVPVAFVVEGEFDAILLQGTIDAAGVDAAAVTLGSAGASVNPASWTHKLGHLWQLVINYDDDEAGRKGQEKWLSAYPYARQARQPIGDVTDFWRAHGQRGLVDWLRGELA
ncbi:MAG: hypothetical protein KDE28_12500 [Anaerolineales bacterium]|nr:hypothetical protein [Anaerolineales bacterium]